MPLRFHVEQPGKCIALCPFEECSGVPDARGTSCHQPSSLTRRRSACLSFSASFFQLSTVALKVHNWSHDVLPKMTRVLAVNNYPSTERFDKLRGCLEGNGATVTVTDRRGCSVSYFNCFDGVALSGSPDMLSTPRTQVKYSPEIDSIRGTKAPLLGVCFGHQLIAIAFGSKVVRDASHVREFVRTDLLTDDPLFVGLPRSTVMLESRDEVVEFLPQGFVQIARSSTSVIAAMKHTRLRLYGLQFHPERYTTEHPDGNIVVQNFVRMLS